MSNRRGKGQEVSRTGLADVLGVSLPTVDHWVRSGMPVRQRGGPGKRWVFNTADVITWRENRLREEASGGVVASAKELQLRRLAAQTALDELALAKARGEVAPLWQVQRGVQSAFAELRTNLRNIPARAVRMLIGEADEIRFKRVLLDEIDQALEALAEADLAIEEDIAQPDEGEE